VTVERDLLISLLKLTKNGHVLIENVKSDAKTTSSIVRNLLEKLQNECLVYLNQDTVEADGYSRLKIAVKAIGMGADVEYVSNMLSWQEFEDIAAVALERNGYIAAKNVRFKHAARKWEIDVVGCRKPLVICVDCKHWRRGTAPSAVRRITEAQVERTRALADALPNVSLELECAKWDRAKFVPAILTLMPVSFKFYDKVPIVPVLQLQDFLCQVPAYTEELKYFLKEFSHLRHDF
jgi:Holliday junction resolvase-like predicted endonuclease